MDKKTIRLLLATSGLLFNIVSLVLFVAPFVSVMGVSVSGFKCISNSPTDFAGTVIALILTCILILYSFMVVIKCIKNENLIDEKLGKVVLFLFGVFALATLILQCCTLVFCKIEDFGLAEIGSGAIASGIIVLFGSVFSMVSCFWGVREKIDYSEEQIEEDKDNKGNNASFFTKNIDFSKLRELKNLLDEGAITQEEFELIKKRMLDDYLKSTSEPNKTIKSK